jgi:hypothetical protein
MMTAPWCANEVQRIYVGNSPSTLRQFDVAARCKPRACGCTIFASELLSSGDR